MWWTFRNPTKQSSSGRATACGHDYTAATTSSPAYIATTTTAARLTTAERAGGAKNRSHAQLGIVHRDLR